MHKDKLVITYVTENNTISQVDDSVCDYKFQIEIDPSDMSTHQLFNVFSKLLAVMGYNEFSIMKGACGLAFNDMRDMKDMDKLVQEYELDHVSEEMQEQERRKSMYKRVDYSSKDNDGYEPG
jgi:hypothetical protein